MSSPNFKTTVLVALTLFLIPSQFLLAQYNVSTIAGGGPNDLAALNTSIGFPASIAFDTAGNAYIADTYLSSQILKVPAAGTTPGNVTVVAGNGTFGYSGDGGPATSAALNQPEGVAVDALGNIFIADTQNSVIREVVASTGNIQTVAGTGTEGYSGDGGPATSAQLNDPVGIFVDSAGDIFIADAGNCLVREVSNGNIATAAGNPALQLPCGYSGDGGPAISAQLDLPEGVFVDGSGNLFIADTDNNLIRAVNIGTSSNTVAGVAIPPGDIQTVAGAFYNSQGGTACATYSGVAGPALSAQLCVPSGVFVDGSENIFIADSGNSVIREIATSGVNMIATVAGDGTAGFSGDGALATSAELYYPSNMAVDSSDDIFVADTNNSVIREVTASTGDISTIIGNTFVAYSGDGGSPLNAELNFPGGVFVDGSGNIFVADTASSVIREVGATSGDIQTVAGNGTPCVSFPPICGDGGPATSTPPSATLSQLNNPNSMFVDAAGDIFIADTEDNRIRVVNTGTAQITIANVAIPAGAIATVAGVDSQQGVTCAYSGDGGPALSAQLCSPAGLFVDSAENIFIADSVNQRIREVAASTGIITTVAGNGTECASSSATCGDGGAAVSAQLANPTGIFVDSSENIYIADTGDNRIRVVNSSAQAVTVAGVAIPPGNIATVAGTGVEGYSGDDAAATSAQIAAPNGVFVDTAGDIFIADTNNFVIREVVASSAFFIATVAGNNTPGFSGDGGPSASAEFSQPLSVFGDSASNLYVADTDNSRIRKLVPTITAPSAAQPSPQTTPAGGTATYTIALNANSGNPKYPITLSCLQSSLPTGASCSFSPAIITPGPLPVPFTLTVTVPTSSAFLQKQHEKRKGAQPLLFFAFGFAPLAGILLASIGGRNKQCRWLWLARLCVTVILLNACGGGGGGPSTTPPTGTTYTIKIQGTTTAQPTPVTITTATLTVQ